ncbi:MAG: hypothetical protein SGILL_010084, partial [Bacillariaceae sp.]
MHFSAASVLSFLALAASTTAFAPVSTTGHQSSALYAQQQQQQQNNDKTVNNNALSFVAAASLAMGTAFVAPTVDFQHTDAATTSTPIVHIGIPAANALGGTKKEATTAAAAAPKLAKEESERNASKKNLELAQASLKEYQKYTSDLTAAYKKAANVAQSTEKQATDAKNTFMRTNDKLSK